MKEKSKTPHSGKNYYYIEKNNRTLSYSEDNPNQRKQPATSTLTQCTDYLTF